MTAPKPCHGCALYLPNTPEVVGLIIPFEQLEAETLTRLIEDLVSREGTDNGDDTPLSLRVERVHYALKRGTAVIFFDAATQQCVLLPREAVSKNRQ